MKTRQQRQATPDRWQRALQRAQFASVEAKQLAGSGEWIVASASRPGIAYRASGITCDCEAAMLGGDPVCLHRAAYWYALGELEQDPEPGLRLRPLWSSASGAAARRRAAWCVGARVSQPLVHKRQRFERREPARTYRVPGPGLRLGRVQDRVQRAV